MNEEQCRAELAAMMEPYSKEQLIDLYVDMFLRGHVKDVLRRQLLEMEEAGMVRRRIASGKEQWQKVEGANDGQ